MDSKELSELRELVEFLKASDIAEFAWTRGDVVIELKFQSAAAPAIDMAQLAQLMAHAPAAAPAIPTHVVAAPVAHSHVAAEPAPAAAAEPAHHIVKSPIVGTFYDSPAPGSPPFVKVGDVVEVGQVLCIVEAMKLMNEIESDAAGEIVERIVQTGQPVEYGQSLFAIKAR
jgi:acetyl-CoA carboxylase biotin carboxyl carrier protein